MDTLEALLGKLHGTDMSCQINRDKFYEIASERFTPQSDINAVINEANRLRSLANDVNVLVKAGLIKLDCEQ